MDKLIQVTFTDGSQCWLDVVQYLALDPRTVRGVSLRPDLAVAGPMPRPVAIECHSESLAVLVANR